MENRFLERIYCETRDISAHVLLLHPVAGTSQGDVFQNGSTSNGQCVNRFGNHDVDDHLLQFLARPQNEAGNSDIDSDESPRFLFTGNGSESQLNRSTRTL